MNAKAVFLCWLVFGTVSCPAADAVPQPEFTNVYVSGTAGVNTYRIPALIMTQKKSLLVFCEARKESIADASPTDMVVRRSVDDGATWGPITTIFKGTGKEAMMNPCAVQDEATGRILLVCINAHKVKPEHHRHYLLTSDDDGVTWSRPVELADKIENYDDTFVPGPGVGVQLRSGRLVIPGYRGEWNDKIDSGCFSCVLTSDDHGAHWKRGANVPFASDESQAVELSDGRLMINMRSDVGKSCRDVAISEDGGETWKTQYWDTTLNECPCQASIVRYSRADGGGKSRILFANPDNSGAKYGVVERTKLTVRISYDEGKTWPVKKLVHAGPSSYSSIVRLPDGGVGVVFEGGEKHRREWIRFVRMSLEWLTDGKDRL